MYHEPKGIMLRRPGSIGERCGPGSGSLDTAARLAAVLIVCGLPFIILWALLRLALEEARGIGRGIREFYLGAAEEMAKSRTR